jgi:23S rRNA pseudouridine1911/1915/1917 synthase
VEIKTGRTHQIRVHMAHAGFPVLGDRVYGGAKVARLGDLSIDRQMLHAKSLSLLHPVTGTPLTFSAPPPKDMAEIIERLLQERAIRAKTGCPFRLIQEAATLPASSAFCLPEKIDVP